MAAASPFCGPKARRFARRKALPCGGCHRALSPEHLRLRRHQADCHVNLLSNNSRHFQFLDSCPHPPSTLASVPSTPYSILRTLNSGLWTFLSRLCARSALDHHALSVGRLSRSRIAPHERLAYFVGSERPVESSAHGNPAARRNYPNGHNWFVFLEIPRRNTCRVAVYYRDFVVVTFFFSRRVRLPEPLAVTPGTLCRANRGPASRRVYRLVGPPALQFGTFHHSAWQSWPASYRSSVFRETCGSGQRRLGYPGVKRPRCYTHVFDLIGLVSMVKQVGQLTNVRRHN